jgi:predicted amino acid racemase
MPKKRFCVEQIVMVLRQVDVLMSLELDQAKRMKELERANVRLKRLVADLSLEKPLLQDVASGNFSIRGA